MKNLKTILPMLAFVLAIGMSFAFTNATEDDYYVTGYIFLDNSWEKVEVDCEPGSFDCEVIIEGEDPNQPYEVLDAPEGNLLPSSSADPIHIKDPRS